MAGTKTTREAPAAEEPTVIYLGNRKAVQLTGDGERMAVPGKQCTTVILRPDASVMEAAQEITHPQGVWTAHSDGTPAWVAVSGPLADTLGPLLAAHYKCELREPEPAQEA